MDRAVIIDPGHGGEGYPGAIGPTGLQEKDFVLDISRKLAQDLPRYHIPVLMTRDDDTHVSLDERVAFAQEQAPPAVLFVSIHANAAGDPRADGIEVWYPNDVANTHEYAAGVALAFLCQRHLYAATRDIYRGCRCKNVERQEFRVLRRAPVAAVLIETGFVTNPENEQLMKTQWYREKVARGITNGIRQFWPTPAGP